MKLREELVPLAIQALIDAGRYRIADTGLIVPTMEFMYYPDEEWLAALKRQRALIAEGMDLELDDSNMPGNKHTHASWGMCSDDLRLWPTADLHIWPNQFLEEGRIAPRGKWMGLV